jgi:hypothetical protein
MAFLDTKRDRAAFLIFILGLGLVWTLWPYTTGLIGAPVLYIVFAPIYRWLARRTPTRVAAGLVVLLGIILVLGPGVSFLGVVAGEAQDMATGVIQSPLLSRLRELRIGPYDVGAQIETLGSRLVSFIGASALGLIGTATRLGIQLTIAFFGLCVNITGALLLHSASGHNLNVRGAYLHVLGDLLGSVGAISAAVIILTIGWLPADPLISIAVSTLILIASWRLIRDSVDILLESVPRHIDLGDVHRAILEIPGVEAVHDLHVWRVGPDHRMADPNERICQTVIGAKHNHAHTPSP